MGVVVRVIAGLAQLFLQPSLLLPFLPDALLQFQHFILELPDLHLGGELLTLHAGQLLFLCSLGLPQAQHVHLVTRGHRCHLLLQQTVDARTAYRLLQTRRTVLAGEEGTRETGGTMGGLLTGQGVPWDVEGFFSWDFDTHFGIADGVFAVGGLATLPLHYCYFIIKSQGRTINYGNQERMRETRWEKLVGKEGSWMSSD